MQTGARQRPSMQNQLSNRLGSRPPTVEYVNRLGERVSPVTGRPYDIEVDSGTNGLAKRIRTGKRKRPIPVKLAGSMFGNLDPIPTDVTIDPPPRACFNCWQMGHSRRDCTRASHARFCNNCGRRGEDLRSCPRCSRAHNEFLLRIQARERGEEVESEEVVDESLLGAEGNMIDDCDDLLRELIHQDDMRRSGYSQETYKYRNQDHRERRLSEQPSYRDREENEYAKEEYSSGTGNNYVTWQDDEESDARPDSRQRDRDHQSNYSYRKNKSTSVLITTVNSENEHELAGGYYRDEERDRDYRARASRSENRNEEMRRRKAPSANDDVDLDNDPVQEVLELAKSIAHLTPETQDLIMRQVMAERKERIRLRARRLEERDGNSWDQPSAVLF